jgi:RND family efflux transporter MFP subunit
MRFKTLAAVLLKQVAPVVIGLAVMGLVIAWLAGVFHDKIQPGQQSIAARKLSDQPTAVVKEVVKQSFEEAIGTLKASNRTIVSAKILATIQEVNVAAGDQVAAGQLLVRLASDEYEARWRQAEQALEGAKATRLQAESSYTRAQKLRASRAGVISQAEFDEIVARVNVARADENRQNQAVTEAKVLLSYTNIAAPRAGKVVDRLAEPGDTAQPGRPLLVLYDEASLRLEAPVVEDLAVKLAVGQPLKVRIDALDREVEGIVGEIVPQAQAMSRSLLVKVTLPAADDRYEGMFGRLIIPAGERQHLCLPVAAIQEVGQLKFVDVVRADDTLERRLVTIGQLGEDDRVEVLSGVDQGERVALQPAPQSVREQGGDG